MSWLFDKPTTAAYRNGNRNRNWLTTDCIKCLVPRAVCLILPLALSLCLFVCFSFSLCSFFICLFFSCLRYLYLSFISYLRVLLLLPSIVYLCLSTTVTAFVSLYLYLYLYGYSCICTQSSNWVCRSICTFHIPSICQSSHVSVYYVSNYVSKSVFRFSLFESWAFRIRIFICISICISVYTRI